MITVSDHAIWRYNTRCLYPLEPTVVRPIIERFVQEALDTAGDAPHQRRLTSPAGDWVSIRRLGADVRVRPALDGVGHVVTTVVPTAWRLCTAIFDAEASLAGAEARGDTQRAATVGRLLPKLRERLAQTPEYNAHRSAADPARAIAATRPERWFDE